MAAHSSVRASAPSCRNDACMSVGELSSKMRMIGICFRSPVLGSELPRRLGEFKNRSLRCSAAVNDDDDDDDDSCESKGRPAATPHDSRQRRNNNSTNYAVQR